MEAEKIALRFQQRVTYIVHRQVVSAKRRRHQQRRIEATGNFPQSLQLVGADISRVANIPFVGKVRIPVAMFLLGADDRLNIALV